jgi:hypothetical protein
MSDMPAPEDQIPKTPLDALKAGLGQVSGSISVADAAERSGLSLREAERGLHALVSEFRGHLSATENGELLFSFPTGFKKPWERTGKIKRFFGRIKRAVVGVGKFVVRAWISVVLIGYVVGFAALLIGLTFAGKGDRDGPSFGGFLIFHALFRLILDALFWTFHPWSPLYVGDRVRGGKLSKARKKSAAFYEKVNRFVFGPEALPEDPRAQTRALLSLIRAKKGRIGVADVMRVTGLSRQDVDPILSRLLLDYDGDVKVSDDGGITYHFPDVRRTAMDAAARVPTSVWNKKEKATPITGNSLGSNLLIGGLNAFNLVMGAVSLSMGLTLDRVQMLFSGIPLEMLPPPESLPLVLGAIPFFFSIGLFGLPLWRMAVQPLKEEKAALENGRRGLLKAILTRLSSKGLDEKALKKAYEDASGKKVDSKTLTHELVKMGAEVDVTEEGRAMYRFRDLEAEVAALEAERAAAKSDEAKVGEVVFSSADAKIAM